VECVIDCTGLLTILGNEWNVLLTVLGYCQYLRMSAMCYWLKYVTDCTGLLTILGCWMHLGNWMDYPTDRTGLLIGPTYRLYRVAGWTWLLTVRTLLLTRLGC